MFDTSICKNKCLAYNIHMSLWVGCVSTEHSPATSAISSIRISLVPNKKLYTVSCLARPSECYIRTKSTRTSYMKSHVVVSRESGFHSFQLQNTHHQHHYYHHQQHSQHLYHHVQHHLYPHYHHHYHHDPFIVAIKR